MEPSGLESLADAVKDLRLPSRFTDDRAEYEAANKGAERNERVGLTPALYLPERVKPTSETFRGLSEAVDEVNVLRPILAYRQLRRLRTKYRELERGYRELLSDRFRRLRAGGGCPDH